MGKAQKAGTCDAIHQHRKTRHFAFASPVCSFCQQVTQFPPTSHSQFFVFDILAMVNKVLLVEKIVDFLARRRGGWIVLFVVFLATILSVSLGALKFSGNTVDDYSPSKRLKSYDDFVQFEDKFSDFVFEDVEVVVIKRTNGQAVLTNTSEAICSELNATLSQYISFTVRDFLWYYRYHNAGLDTIANIYLSNDHTAMLFAIQMDIRGDTDSFIQDARNLVDDLGSRYSSQGYDITLTGKLTASQISAAKTGKGFAVTDGSGLPVIAIIFWYEVGSFRLLLIPGIALGCALMVSWAIGNSLAVHSNIKIPSYEPNIMLFLCMAMSIDYSFFLLTRFQEERRVRNADVQTAVVSMLLNSGSIVLVSGSILVVTWLALCFFPVYGLDAVGYCSAIAVLMCIVMNLLLCPSLLLTFPNFFGRAAFTIRDDLSSCCACFRKSTDIDDYSSINKDVASRVDPDGQNKDKHNMYYKIATVVTRLPWSLAVPGAVYLVFVLGCLLLQDFSFSIGTTVSFGTGKTADTYDSLFSTFSTGVFTAPFGIMGTYLNDSQIFNDEYFNASCRLAKNIATLKHVMIPSIIGITFQNNDLGHSVNNISCIDASQAIAWALSHNNETSQDAAAYQWKLAKYSDVYTNETSIFTFAVDFNSYSTESIHVVHHTRDAISDANNALEAVGSNLRFYFYHPIVSEVDAEEFALVRFPYVLAGTLFVIFSLISLRFQAAFIPFKLCLTIVVPILFVFGLAVGVFQRGALNFLGFDPLKGTGGISWLVPCATIFLLIGLAIDYDIFLFSRVYELRKSGLGTRDSIIQAVEITGPVISGAGLIMALAFAGMIVSSNEFLNEQGFIMILGVLIDTYIVRVVLVPSVLSLGGWINWWPVRMPEPRSSKESLLPASP
eukprot:c11488_g1_i4.p1 GENE.c11488_g1_i4~~c11488_g1_i4.p1  ORF type:complete len:892 (+),score=217.63 c11488_g1_i4:1-2676(+)